MTKPEKTGNGQAVLRWIVVLASVLWIGFLLYRFYFDADPDQYGARSPEVVARMEACSGSFRERYECKEAAIIDKGREDFVGWLGQMGLMLGPPAALWAGLGLLRRRRAVTAEPQNYVPPPVPISKYRVW